MYASIPSLLQGYSFIAPSVLFTDNMFSLPNNCTNGLSQYDTFKVCPYCNIHVRVSFRILRRWGREVQRVFSQEHGPIIPRRNPACYINFCMVKCMLVLSQCGSMGELADTTVTIWRVHCTDILWYVSFTGVAFPLVLEFPVPPEVLPW